MVCPKPIEPHSRGKVPCFLGNSFHLLQRLNLFIILKKYIPKEKNNKNIIRLMLKANGRKLDTLANSKTKR